MIGQPVSGLGVILGVVPAGAMEWMRIDGN